MNCEIKTNKMKTIKIESLDKKTILYKTAEFVLRTEKAYMCNVGGVKTMIVK